MRRKAIRISLLVVAIAVAIFGVLIAGGGLASARVGRELGDLDWRGLRDSACFAAAKSADDGAHRYYVQECATAEAKADNARP